MYKYNTKMCEYTFFVEPLLGLLMKTSFNYFHNLVGTFKNRKLGLFIEIKNILLPPTVF